MYYSNKYAINFSLPITSRYSIFDVTMKQILSMYSQTLHTSKTPAALSQPFVSEVWQHLDEIPLCGHVPATKPRANWK